MLLEKEQPKLTSQTPTHKKRKSKDQEKGKRANQEERRENEQKKPKKNHQTQHPQYQQEDTYISSAKIQLILL
jgi:2-methylcitrate dehydratase PrpD